MHEQAVNELHTVKNELERIHRTIARHGFWREFMEVEIAIDELIKKVKEQDPPRAEEGNTDMMHS